MCDVPSIAVFCSESIECFPGTASKFFFKLLVTIPVAPIITGIIVHFRFHICCISIHKLLYFNFFSASFCTTFIIIIVVVVVVFSEVRMYCIILYYIIYNIFFKYFKLKKLHSTTCSHSFYLKPCRMTSELLCFIQCREGSSA